MDAKTFRADLDLIWNLLTTCSDELPVGANCSARRALPVLRASADWQQSAELFRSLKLGTLPVGWSHFVFPKAPRLGQACVVGSLGLELKDGRFREWNLIFPFHVHSSLLVHLTLEICVKRQSIDQSDALF